MVIAIDTLTGLVDGKEGGVFFAQNVNPLLRSLRSLAVQNDIAIVVTTHGNDVSNMTKVGRATPVPVPVLWGGNPPSPLPLFTPNQEPPLSPFPSRRPEAGTAAARPFPLPSLRKRGASLFPQSHEGNKTPLSNIVQKANDVAVRGSQGLSQIAAHILSVDKLESGRNGERIIVVVKSNICRHPLPS